MAETDVRTFQASPNSVVFKTSGVWRTGDLVRLATSVERLYKAFLAAHMAEVELSGTEERLSNYFAETRRMFEELPEEQRRPFFLGLISPPSELFSTLVADQSRYVGFLYDNIYRLAPNEQLNIGATRLSSPGWISFEGLGEPIRQLREFIKDLHYRNQQERELGRLEIARQHLELRREFGDLLSGPANKVGIAALEEADVLEQLEIEGKLVDVPDNIDPETSDDS